VAGFAQARLRAAEYAAEVMGWRPERITAVTRFADGNRHAVHRVSCGAADVVVRVAHDLDPAPAAREAAVLELVGGVAAPALYDFRRASRWFDAPAMCLEFLPGGPRELSAASRAEIERLAAVVAWVHARPVSELAEPLASAGDLDTYARERLRSILATLRWARDPLPAALQAKLREAADRLAVQDAFGAGDAPALLHGDIAFGNVLWGPAPALIDWEYTRLGDPADEIAYLFDQNALSPAQRETFWAGYGRRVERVAWWEPLTRLGSALWWVERWIRRVDGADPTLPREPGYYFDQLVRRVERL
jgi:aminoglycoside phosphotransferase (APT) family kinase protein